MAIRYQGDPIRVVKPEDAVDMIARTAMLPDQQVEGALVRFAVEYGGNQCWVHYMVVSRKPFTLRRVIGLEGDNELLDVPASLIDGMNGPQIRFMVDQIKLVYRAHPLLARYRGEQAREKRGMSRIRGKFDATIGSAT